MNSDHSPGILPLSTLVLWMICLTIGLLGFLLPYPWPHPPAKEPTPVIAQVMLVQLTDDSSTPDIGPPSPSDVSQPPDLPREIAAMPGPPMVAVALSSPTIAFALPTTEPIHLPQHLTFGQGEGAQPAPEYPREAVLARQQGTIVIRFTVGEDGRVQTAQAISPCPFPLLNQAAVRAVRETWRFRAGPTRSYEVSIQFQLREKS
jgi:protein TonB